MSMMSRISQTLLALTLMAAGSAWGQITHEIDVRHGKVVYVSGKDLVVKMGDGSVRHVVVPADTVFHVDGKDLSTSDLRPGMELTQTITTTTTNRTVTNVRNVDATVWQVNAPFLIVTLPDGTNKQVRVPDGTKFKIDGEDRTVFDLRRGMRLTGTIVTETPETEISRSSRITGTAPPTPTIIGVLLFEEPEK
jgi:hypothetical protein